MTLICDLWNTITIVVALNTFHNNFDMTTTSLLETKNKIIKKIQSIL